MSGIGFLGFSLARRAWGGARGLRCFLRRRIYRFLPVNRKDWSEKIRSGVSAQEYAGGEKGGGAVYSTIYGEKNLSLKLPVTRGIRLHREFSLVEGVSVPEFGVLRLKLARYLSFGIEGGLVVSKCGRVILNVSSGCEDFWRLGKEYLFCPARYRNKTVAVISSRWGESFAHWICEVLPRIFLLEKAGYKSDKIDFYLMRYSGADFQRETLAYFGVAPEKVMAENDGLNLVCRELITTTVGYVEISDERSGRRSFSTLMPKWAVDAVHGMYRYYLNRVDYDLDRDLFPKKIYLSRRRCKHRVLLNEDEVSGYLEAHGYTPFFPEELSFRDQVLAFGGAESIVAVHGSALANIIFCREGTLVIHLHSPNYINTLYWHIADARDLEYYPLMDQGADVTDSVTCEFAENREHVIEDFSADLSALKRLLREVS